MNNVDSPRSSVKQQNWDPAVFHQIQLEKNLAVLEHLLLLAVIQSYRFYLWVKDRVCPRTGPNGKFRRPDFSRPDFNRIYEMIADYWDMIAKGATTELRLDWPTVETLMRKRMDEKLLSQEEAEAIWPWLKQDLEEITIDPELLRTLPRNPFFCEWLRQKATAHELQQLTSISLGHVPGIADLREAMRNIERSAAPSPARSIFDFVADPGEELIGPHRYLCRKGGLLMVAQTGAGKSVWIAQAGVCFSCGRSFLGMVPTRPLKVLLIQAENDGGDISSFREGVLSHLRLTEAERALVGENFLVVTETARTGDAFLNEVVAPNLEQHRPDLLLIDPALSFLGGEASSQVDVGGFLRNGLNPLLAEHNCGTIIVTHVPKPSSEREKWQGNDYAYAAFGSSEWSNWARAILVLVSTKTEGVFELRAAKRGARLRWIDNNGQPTTLKHLSWSREEGRYYWTEAAVPTGKSDDELIWELLPSAGPVTTAWQKAADTQLGIKRATFYRALKRLRLGGRILQTADLSGWIQVKARVQGEIGGGNFAQGINPNNRDTGP